jgi:hypothetical protein
MSEVGIVNAQSVCPTCNLVKLQKISMPTNVAFARLFGFEANDNKFWCWVCGKGFSGEIVTETPKSDLIVRKKHEPNVERCVIRG